MQATIEHEVQVNWPFDLLTRIVRQLGPGDLLRLRRTVEDALGQCQPASTAEEGWDEGTFLDTELVHALSHEADERITIEGVREPLSSIKGSLARTVITERQAR